MRNLWEDTEVLSCLVLSLFCIRITNFACAMRGFEGMRHHLALICRRVTLSELANDLQ